MREERADLLRACAYGYAFIMVLVGVALLVVMYAINSAFGSNRTDWALIALFTVPAIIYFALAPFISRQQAWAMIAALALTIALRAMIGIDNSLIGWVTTMVVIVFAVLTGLRLWLGVAPPR